MSGETTSSASFSVPVRVLASRRLSIVLLHGHDSLPGAWVDFIDDLSGQLAARFPDVAGAIDFRALSGPVALPAGSGLAAGPGLAGGSGGSGGSARFAWFDENDVAFPDAAHAARWVASRLAGPSVLIGFSQGAAVALTLGFGGEASGGAQNSGSAGSKDAGDGDILGIVALSGFLPDGIDGPSVADRAPLAAGGPLLVMHGEDDEVVDVLYGERAARTARAAGAQVQVELGTYGHTLPTDISPIVSWLEPLLEPLL